MTDPTPQPSTDEREVLVEVVHTFLATEFEPESEEIMHDQAHRLAKAIQHAGFHRTPAPTGDEFSEAVLSERMRHAAKGYDDAHDAEHGLVHLLDWAMEYAKRGEYIKAMSLVLAAKDQATATPAPSDEDVAVKLRHAHPGFPQSVYDDFARAAVAAMGGAK